MSIDTLISTLTPLTWVILSFGLFLLAVIVSFAVYVNGLGISRAKKILTIFLAFLETSALVFLLLATCFSIFMYLVSAPKAQDLETRPQADFPSPVPTQTFTPTPWPSETPQATETPAWTSTPQKPNTPPGPDAWLLLSISKGSPENHDIYLIDPGSTILINLTQSESNDVEAVASPDGSAILFISNGGQGRGLYLMNADGSQQRVLYDSPGSEMAGSFSPDGKQVVFASDVGGQHNLYIINIDGQELKRLTDDSTIDLYPAWSPDGQTIVFSRRERMDSDENIFLIAVDGSNLRQLTDETGFNTQPCWSPNGRQILFTSGVFKNADLFIMNADGSDRHEIEYTRNYYEFDAKWSPDGNWIVFSRLDPNKYFPEVWMMTPDGSHLNKIPLPAMAYAYLSFPSWIRR